MEAVPKLPLLSFELKTSPENTHFGPKLKLYISEAYREDPDSYSNEMHQLEGLRSAAVRPSNDSAGLNALNRYFCQLRAMQSRFPMGKGQPASCSYVWKDLYANMSCTSADIRFEMACILYNIGALHTQLGASEPRTTADSLKAACTHYQNAAWAFQYLREQFPQPPGMDVSSDIMRLLQEICFAQAQECILDKSIQDTRKPSVVGAVATQVMFFYRNSLALLGPSTGTDNIHEIIGTKLFNYWHRHLSFKKFYIGCIVCLYQGMNAEEQQKMGERVSFYQQAVDKLSEARKLAKHIEPVQVTQEALTFTNDVVEGKRKAAKNENEFIYHEEVPEKDMLVDLKPVCLVKLLPINFNDPEISGTDIFSRLVPIKAHEASSLYSEEKAKLLRHIVNQCEVKNMELTEFMSSLQLDQLEVLDSDQKIPQEIVDRCAAMNAKTEIIQTLVDSMNNLAEIITDVEHSLSEIKNSIQEETLKEKEYQKTMGPRPPSIVQTELSREYHKYQEAHTRTNESNQVLHKAMTLHIANLRLLSQPLDVLQAKIPSIDNIEGLDRDSMKEMRRVVSKAREMQTQRDSLLQQLREAVASDDITAQILSRSETNEEIFKQEIEKHTPKVKIIEQNLAAQENIINKLTSLYAAYGESRRLLADVLRKRDGLINALITSYDTYEELLGKSQKGLEFYKKLSHNVNQLLTRLRSTCQVQDEERMQLLAKQNKQLSKAPSPATVTPAIVKPSDIASVPVPAPTGGGLKLKDYLPYMKNRALARNITPQVQMEHLPPDSGYYPESIYPTSVRPAPVGSEATDITQMKMPDGVVLPTMTNPQNPYNRYDTPYQNEPDPYSVPTNYGYPNQGYQKPDDGSNYGYSTPYTPSQSSQIASPQTYSNPYYSATQDNATLVSDAQTSYSQFGQTNSIPNVQHNPYIDPYVAHSQAAPIPDATSMHYNAAQTDLAMNFSQMQVAPKSEPTYGEYSQTYFNMQYPQASTPNIPTYSNAPQNSATSVSFQLPSNFSSMTYPHAADQLTQYSQIPTVSNAYNVQDPQYSYATTSAYETVSQGYTIYTNADSTSAMSNSSKVSTVAPANIAVSSTFPSGPDNPHLMDPIALAQLEANDKPIKSHVTGEALAPDVIPQNFKVYDGVNYSAEQNYQPNTNYVYPDQNVNYAHTYQNHPGYTYNMSTGNYDYNYGSQNSYTSSAQNVTHSVSEGSNWSTQGVYTSAGTFQTLQSPSETPQNEQTTTDHPANNPSYYHTPYGYQTTTIQSNEVVQNNQPVSTNYGANMNQSTYMQSTQEHDTSVTYSKNQVSMPKEPECNFSQSIGHANQSSPAIENTPPPEQNTQHIDENPPPSVDDTTQSQTPVPEVSTEIKTHQRKTEVLPTTFDLLSDIDFSVEQKPLMPEIKVPQISESAIKKPIVPKLEPILKPVPKEEVIERPAKRDLFSDPLLLNKFTQEVKNLQKLVDSLTNKTQSGLTLLDSKWKMFQDVQIKQNMNKTKTIAMQHSEGNIVTEVVPFDDSRLTLKSDPDAFINACYYKQLAPWCIPLVISNNPTENEHGTFWRAVLENKISCVVCLLSEIEIQGYSYWPTAKGQSLELSDIKVTLDEVTCNVHWTERKLTVASGKTVHSVTHYQINVFPVKIVCTPLVLLADKVLSETYENRLSNQLTGAWLQCAAGAGRSSVIALLVMVMCQVRAGQIHLCDMLDVGCINLCKHRSNVLEDTKYLSDAYRAALFYVQGVLCSGTTMFSGEAVSVPTGASVLPPVTPTPASTSSTNQKPPQKFSRESFEEMKQSPGLKSGDMKDPLNFLDPLWSLKKK